MKLEQLKKLVYVELRGIIKDKYTRNPKGAQHKKRANYNNKKKRLKKNRLQPNYISKNYVKKK